MTDDAKPSLAERIEQMVKQINQASDIYGVTHINAKGSAEKLRAIAAELREIADEVHSHGAYPNLDALADRLARREK